MLVWATVLTGGHAGKYVLVPELVGKLKGPSWVRKLHTSCPAPELRSRTTTAVGLQRLVTDLVLESSKCGVLLRSCRSSRCW